MVFSCFSGLSLTAYAEAETPTVTVSPENSGTVEAVEDGGWRYYDNGEAVKDWKKLNEKWYYFNSNGTMANGWIYDNGNWYYLNSWGGMRTDNLTYKGKVYRFASNGACLNP